MTLAILIASKTSRNKYLLPKILHLWYFIIVGAKIIHKRLNDKWDHIKIKYVCSVKDLAQRGKRQAANGEKMFSKHISNKTVVENI